MNFAIHAARRQRFTSAIGPRAAAVFAAPPETTRSNDTHFRYRPSSDLVYLTGFDEPETRAGAAPRRRDRDASCCSCARAIPSARPGTAAAPASTARCATSAPTRRFPIARARRAAARAPRERATPATTARPATAAFDARLCHAIARHAHARAPRRAARPSEIVDPRVVLHEMRLCKTPEELDAMRRAAAITARGAHRRDARGAARHATSTRSRPLLEYASARHGASGPGYGTHRRRGRERDHPALPRERPTARGGDLLLIDAGAEYDYYARRRDAHLPRRAARSRPRSARVYDVVLRAQEAAIEAVRPGATLDADPRAGGRVAHRGPGRRSASCTAHVAADRSSDGRVQAVLHAPHQSHWLGMDVHDVGAYSRRRASRARSSRAWCSPSSRASTSRDDDDQVAAASTAASACASRTTSS